MAKNSKPVMVRMPPELYERVKLAADSTMSNPAVICRLLIKQALDGWTLPGDEDYDGVTLTAPSPSYSPGHEQPPKKRKGKRGRR